MRLKWLDPLVAVKEDIVKEVMSKLGVEKQCTLPLVQTKKGRDPR